MAVPGPRGRGASPPPSPSLREPPSRPPLASPPTPLPGARNPRQHRRAPRGWTAGEGRPGRDCAGTAAAKSAASPRLLLDPHFCPGLCIVTLGHLAERQRVPARPTPPPGSRSCPEVAGGPGAAAPPWPAGSRAYLEGSSGSFLPVSAASPRRSDPHLWETSAAAAMQVRLKPRGARPPPAPPLRLPRHRDQSESRAPAPACPAAPRPPTHAAGPRHSQPSVPAKVPRVPLGPEWRPKRLRLSPSQGIPAFALQDPRVRRSEACALELPWPLPASAPLARVSRGGPVRGGGAILTAGEAWVPGKGRPLEGWGLNPRGSGVGSQSSGGSLSLHVVLGAQPGTRIGVAHSPRPLSPPPTAPPKAGLPLVEG